MRSSQRYGSSQRHGAVAKGTFLEAQTEVPAGYHGAAPQPGNREKACWQLIVLPRFGFPPQPTASAVGIPDLGHVGGSVSSAVAEHVASVPAAAAQPVPAAAHGGKQWGVREQGGSMAGDTCWAAE